MASDHRTTCRQLVAGTNATLTAGLADCKFTGGADEGTAEKQLFDRQRVREIIQGRL